MRTAAFSSRPLLRVRVRPGATMAQAELVVGQATIALPPAKRGFHLITNRVRIRARLSHTSPPSHATVPQVVQAVSADLDRIAVGLCHVFSALLACLLTPAQASDPCVSSTH